MKEHGYKLETLKKYMNMVKAYMAICLSCLESLHVCISYGNSKIGRCMNVSLAPIYTCANCGGCSRLCYDIKACMRFVKNVLYNRVKNTALAMHDRDRFFDEIGAAMDRKRSNKYFRWHVAGDILDLDYFQRMVDNAIAHPDFIIWTYTKNYTVVNTWIRDNGPLPSNFTVMFSKWDGMPMDNPYNMPVFAVKLKDGNKDPMAWETMFKCPGNCDVCKALHRGCIAGENTWNDEH